MKTICIVNDTAIYTLARMFSHMPSHDFAVKEVGDAAAALGIKPTDDHNTCAAAIRRTVYQLER